MLKSKLLLIILCINFIFLTNCKKDPIVPSETPEQHLKDSLWAYYPLKGNVSDSSGHNHVLNLLNGTSFTSDQFGNNNYAINFDGYTNYAVIPDGSSFPSGNFSVSLNIMPRQNTGFFFGKQDYNTAKGATFNLGIDNFYVGPVARFSVTTNQSNLCDNIPDSGFICENPSTFYANSWYHVVATFNNGTMKFYINGVLENSLNIRFSQLTMCSNAQFILGDWWSGGHEFFNGKMNQIRIYTRVLSDNEVSNLYDKTKQN